MLKGPNSFFPLGWVSKRQTSLSRSTTESEIVSLAQSLYQEGLPALSLWSVLLGRDDLELVIHEDNHTTILVVKKGYSSKLRHVSRTHKVNLGGISEQLALGGGISIQYVETTQQAADIFTKALPPQQWDNALKLLGIRQSLPEILEDNSDCPQNWFRKPRLLPVAQRWSRATHRTAVTVDDQLTWCVGSTTSLSAGQRNFAAHGMQPTAHRASRKDPSP